MTTLGKLQTWFRAQCDGDWERTFGVRIETTNKPGWRVTIDVSETILADDDFPEYMQGTEGGATWIRCRMVGTQYEGAGDPSRLDEILERFLVWAQDRPDWLSLPPSEDEEDADRDFWLSLGHEVGPEKCRFEGCSRRKIAISVLCRPHHYQMIRGKPCTFEKLSDIPEAPR